MTRTCLFYFSSMEGEGEQPENDFTIKTIVSFLIGMGTNRTSLLYPLTGRRNDQDMFKVPSR